MPASLPPRRYLDHPATSWPKPECVLAAMEHAIRAVGAAPGRGAYREGLAADAIRSAARSAAARMLGSDPQRVALPAGATLGLNMAIHGLVEPGWHVIATAADHNATLRPLHWLSSRGVIELDVVPCDGSGFVDPGDVERAWRPTTRLIVFSHASNVTGRLQDAVGLVAVARQRGAMSILDAAQTAGVVPIDCGPCGADVVVAPGHKWLQGPAGSGVLWMREGLDPRPLLQGGTGTASDTLAMPETFCDRMEAGTPDLAALAGFGAAIGWVEERTLSLLTAHSRTLAAACRAGLAEIRGVRLLTPPDNDGPPIVGFTVEDYDPSLVAALLEQLGGVRARAGFHCAARIHEHLGTTAGGTVRVGFGPHNTPDDAAAVIDTVATITAG